MTEQLIIGPQTTFGEAFMAAQDFGADIMQQVHRDEKGVISTLFVIALGDSAATLHEVISQIERDQQPSGNIVIENEPKPDPAEVDEDLLKVEQIMATLPIEQRHAIERYFGFVSEISIDEEVKRAMQQQGFKTVEEYEQAVAGIGEGITPRTLAIAELVGH